MNRIVPLTYDSPLLAILAKIVPSTCIGINSNPTDNLEKNVIGWVFRVFFVAFLLPATRSLVYLKEKDPIDST